MGRACGITVIRLKLFKVDFLRSWTIHEPCQHDITSLICITGRLWRSDNANHITYLHSRSLSNDVLNRGTTSDEWGNENEHETVRPWNAKIKELIKEGKGKQILQVYEDMKCEGLLPDKITFVCVLTVCASCSFFPQGKQFHACLMDTPFYSDVTLGNALLNFYGKCGSLEWALQIFPEIFEKNIVTWNTMIATYVHNAAWDIPFRLFDQMQNEGLVADAYTFSGVVSACASLTALAEGIILHARILGSELGGNIVLGNALVHMYGKCCAVDNARKVFDLMPSKSVVSWNTMIGVYAQHEYATEALLLFSCMRQEGVTPDKLSFVRALQACAGGADFTDCEDLHDLVLQSGFQKDVSVGNALVKMYAKQGSAGDALLVFKEMIEHDITSWNALIVGFVQLGEGKKAFELYEQMHEEGVLHDKVTITSILSACGLLMAECKGKRMHSIIDDSELVSNAIVRSATINMYIKCENLLRARAMFDETPERDLFSWNAMIAGYGQHGNGLETLELFERMLSQAVLPDKVTFVSTLSGCCCNVTLGECRKLHAQILSCGYGSDNFIQNTLVNMYGAHGNLGNARALFNEINERDVVSWNVLISVYSKHGQGKATLQLFNNMLCEAVSPVKVTFVLLLTLCADIGALAEGVHIHACVASNDLEYDVSVANALISMYGGCDKLEAARKMFDEMRDRSVITWNAMIASLVHHSEDEEAFNLFDAMQLKGVAPDAFTFATILSACAGKLGLRRGEMLHTDIVIRGLEPDVSVGNALLSMYGKCGTLVDARRLFDGMHARNLVSWNAVIAAYAQHGKGKEADRLFGEMKLARILPDRVTFIVLLSASNHAGLVDEGCKYFLSMFQDYNITPNVEHYDCLIDLLGRAGRLDEAEGLLKNMPFEPTALSFMSLLGASKYQADVKRGEQAAECMAILDPENAAPYIMLSHIHAASTS